jgi:rod shape-determining protein MreC
MDTSREDVGIAIRSAFLVKGTKQRFSLFALIVISAILIFIETIETKPLDSFRAIIKDTIYRGSLIVSLPSKGFNNSTNYIKDHINLYNNYNKLKKENSELKNNISKSDFLELENSQLRKLIEEQAASPSNNYVSARVLIDKQSPYLNSFIINIGSNKKIKNGLAVLEEKNFIGRIVDVNYFSSRVLLVSDLNSKIPVVIEPTGYHAILSGHGKNPPTLEYLPKNYKINNGDKVYTSGKGRIFSPGIPIGEVKIENNIANVLLFSNLNQVTFVNIDINNIDRNK